MDASNPNAVYDTGGIRLMTGNLFASAVGPLVEADCPYRGKNAITASAYYREHPEMAREDAIKAFNEEYKGASYDQSLDEAETMAFDTDLDKDEYIIANQYDYMPAIEDPIYNLSEDRLATANTFEQDSDFDLASVSTQTSEPNTKVVFKVYLNDKGAKSPEDGKEVASVEQTFKYGGYHRVKLPQSVRINKGQTFSVVCEATHQSDGKTLYEVCANRQMDKNDAVEAESPYYTKAVVNKNESFVLLDNGWVDLVEQPLVYEAKGEERPAVVDNFKIKAFGLPVKS